MAPPELALYVGPGASFLNDGSRSGSELVPHETVCEVSRGEAETSSHWQPVGANGKPVKTKAPKAANAAKAKRPARQKTAPSESAGTGEAAGAPSEDATLVGKGTSGEGAEA